MYNLRAQNIMKLIVTIPAHNEEKTITDVIHSIPRHIDGIDVVEVLVLSDGSTDHTVEAAQNAGANYVLTNKRKLGLAKTFARILDEALARGADIIVNTDADNQYDQSEIINLIQPILHAGVDMVNGDRQVKRLTWMKTSKKYGNMLGSAFVRTISGTELNDASSGFRAFTRNAAKKFILLSEHTYTHETIIQAGNKNLSVAEVPITFKRREVGESKLISSVGSHVKKSFATIIRSVMMYKAFKVLLLTGTLLIILGAILGIRFVYYFMNGLGFGHIQSLILAAILIITGVNTIFLGVIADLISHNRKILEKIYERQQ